MLQINITLKEIYRELCPECQKKLEAMVKDKMSGELVKRALEGEEKDAGSKDH